MCRVLVLILVLAATGAWARPVIIGVEDQSYLPHSAVVDGKPVGFAAELLQSFARDTGQVVFLRPLPINRLYAEVASGAVDAKYPDNPDWRGPDYRGEYHFRYSKAVVDIIDGVMVRPAFLDQPVKQLRSLAMPLGFSVTDWVSKGGPDGLTIFYSSGIDSLVRMCLLGRAEGCYANIAVMSYWMRENGQDGRLVYDSRLPHAATSYYLSSVHRHDVVGLFDAWLADHPDRLEALKQRFHLPDMGW
jgi:polar amino acid transport system substrate-binding protein